MFILFYFILHLRSDDTIGVFLPLFTNFSATASFSYLIWKETGHQYAPSFQNQARLRRVAISLIETGFIYLAIELAFAVTVVVIWYEAVRGTGMPAVDAIWAYSVLGALSSQIPVRCFNYPF